MNLHDKYINSDFTAEDASNLEALLNKLAVSINRYRPDSPVNWGGWATFCGHNAGPISFELTLAYNWTNEELRPYSVEIFGHDPGDDYWNSVS